MPRARHRRCSAAHFVRAEDAGRLGDVRSSHGGAEQREARSGGRANDRSISERQSGVGARGAAPGRFETERRMIEYRYTADPRTEATCRACHSFGRVLTQRRTRRSGSCSSRRIAALFPDVDFQAFRRGGPAANDSGPVPASDGRGDQSSRARVSAAHAGMDCVVGNDASAASRGHVAAERERAGTRRVLRTHDGDARNGRRRVRHAGRTIATPTAARSCSAADIRSSTPAINGAAGRPIPHCGRATRWDCAK